MSALRFTTTRLSGLRSAGRLQEMQHAAVAGTLERALGSEYGRLYADFETESSDVRAWYADVDAPPRALDALPEAEAEVLRQRVADMIARITAHAAAIAGESVQKASLARILIAATTFPMEDIWADGAQPILVNWGFHRHDVEPGVPRPIRERIGRPARRSAEVAAAPAAANAAAAAPAAAAHPVTTTARRPAARSGGLAVAFSVLLWLLFLGLAGAAYALLLPACGVAGLAPLGACPARGDGTFAEGEALQQLVEGEELRLRRGDSFCRAPAAPPAAR